MQIILPALYPKQAAFVQCDARYTVVEAGTKTGKTVGCLCYLLDRVAKTGKPGRNYWWIAPIYPQAKIAFRRLQRWFAGRSDLARFNESELYCDVANGARIWFKSAEHPDGLYGEDVYAAVVDEATRVREESWHALRTTLTATGGPVKIIGNVKGRKNWAYRLARRAEAGEPNTAYFKLTTADAVDAGIFPAEELADAEANLPLAVYRELYHAEPADDEGNPFGIAAIDACIVPMIPSADACVYGVDLAKSVDWTVVLGLAESGHVCAFERFQADWKQTENRIINRIGNAPALVDSTGVGDPILERLQSGRGNFQGYTFTGPSKQQLMERLAVAIQRREVFFPEGILAQELRSFEYEYSRTGVRYSAPEGLHDDCVCALALAVLHKDGVTQRAALRLVSFDDVPAAVDYVGDEGWVTV